MPSTTHNPERRAWKGRSYKKGGERVKAQREKILASLREALAAPCAVCGQNGHREEFHTPDDLGGIPNVCCSKCGGTLDDGGTCESPKFDNCDRASLTSEPS